MASELSKPRMDPVFWAAAGWLVLVAVSAVTAGAWAVPQSDAMDWEHIAAKPGSDTETAVFLTEAGPQKRAYTYWLGTDTMGRDMVSRLIFGARISLSVGLVSPLIGLAIGGLLGCLAGYCRGRVEAVIVAAMDIILAFPGLVLLLAVTFYLGPSLKNLMATLGFLSIPAFSRVARAKTLVLAGQEFVQAARLTGAGNTAILWREIVPNVITPLIGYGLLVAAFMIMAEGALSYLGLGIPAPAPSWGGMIAGGREVLDQAPHVSMVPAAVMFLTVLSLNLIGDALRQRFEQGKTQLQG